MSSPEATTQQTENSTLDFSQFGSNPRIVKTPRKDERESLDMTAFGVVASSYDSEEN